MSLDALEALLHTRRVDPPRGSYSATLVTDPERAARKIMEEAYELCLELTRGTVDRRRLTEEAADLVFHLLAGLVAVDVGIGDVLAELDARRAPPVAAADHVAAPDQVAAPDHVAVPDVGGHRR